MTLRVSLTPCWILHRRAWRESSVILDALTRDHGRISLVARGARRPRSSWRGLTEPFRALQASFSLRGEMGTLTGLEAGDGSPKLQGLALWCGFYVNELLIRLLPRQEPAPELFDAYTGLLPKLADPEHRAPALRRFEMAVLYETGVAPDLTRDAKTGEPVAAGGWYRLVDETGPVRTSGPGPESWEGQVFLALAGGQIGSKAVGKPGLQRDARKIMGRLLAFHLGDKPLYTRKLLDREES